jgi:GlpG protein
LRKLAALASPELARQFRFYLYNQGIEANEEGESEQEQCEIWILADEEVAAAQQCLQDFSRNPEDRQIAEAVGQGKKRFEQGIKEQRAAEKAAARHASVQNSLLSAFPVTCVVIAITTVFFIFSYIGSAHEITKFLLFSTSYGDYVLREKSFQEIFSGQIWRLITPIFLHKGIFHIFFNLIWFWSFARHIEGQISSRKLAWLLLAISIPSNIAFYLVAGPAFGGLSGVNYGLYAYLWYRGNYSTELSLRPDPGLGQFFVVWYIICLGMSLLGGMIGMKVANSIHGMGALMGILVAVWDAGNGRHLVRTFKHHEALRKQVAIGAGLLLAGFIVDFFMY